MPESLKFRSRDQLCKRMLERVQGLLPFCRGGASKRRITVLRDDVERIIKDMIVDE